MALYRREQALASRSTRIFALPRHLPPTTTKVDVFPYSYGQCLELQGRGLRLGIWLEVRVRLRLARST